MLQLGLLTAELGPRKERGAGEGRNSALLRKLLLAGTWMPLVVIGPDANFYSLKPGEGREQSCAFVLRQPSETLSLSNSLRYTHLATPLCAPIAPSARKVNEECLITKSIIKFG